MVGGEYMQMFEMATGVKVFGIENSEQSVRKAQENGLQVYQSFIENSHESIPDAPYDAFYIMNFLEHIPNPKEFLRGIFHNLNEDAIGLVEVPNFDMMVEKGLYSEFIRDHVSYFTKDTLKSMLENSGFQVESVEIIWNQYIISAIVKKKKTEIGESFQNQYQKIFYEVAKYLQERRQMGEIVVWGAGHQALANIALLNMKEDIKCVIDAADFKQNKYTPSTHLRIVAPEILQTDDSIKTIIIMAGSYSFEIERIIKEKYNKIEREIAILNENGIKVL